MFVFSHNIRLRERVFTAHKFAVREYKDIWMHMQKGGLLHHFSTRTFRAAYRSCSDSLSIAVPRQPRATLPLYH